MVLGHQKPSIFSSIFHYFSYLFKTPFPRPFLEGQSAGLYSKVRSGPGALPPRRGRVGIRRLSWEFPSCCFPFLLGFLLDVLLVGDHLASILGTRGRRKLIPKINTFLNRVFLRICVDFGSHFGCILEHFS